MRHQYTRIFVLIAGFSFGGLNVQAQVVPGARPTHAQCTTAAKAFAAAPHEDTSIQTLPACGRIGGRALARAFQGARLETKTETLEKLYRALSSMRDPDVFASALSVMQDAGATPSARATAILVAVAQHDNALSPPINVPFRDLISSSHKANCRLVHTTDASYRSTSPLPAGALSQLKKALVALRSSPDAPSLVQAFAECALPVLKQGAAAAHN